MSIKASIDNWNIHVQSWLANYIFLRVPAGLPGDPAKLVTFLSSAFWHGFFPGYYITFVNVMLFQEAAKALVKAVDPDAPGAKDGRSASGWSVYGTITGPPGTHVAVRGALWLAQFACDTLFMTYAGAAFVVVGSADIGGRSVGMLERIGAIYGKMYYAGHVVAVLAFVAAFALAPRKARREKKEGKGE